MVKQIKYNNLARDLKNTFAILVSLFVLSACDSSGDPVDAAFNGGASSSSSSHLPVVITPNSQTVAEGASIQFLAAGGVPPYSYLVLTGEGSIDATTGLFEAPFTAGGSVIEVLDSANGLALASVTVNATGSLAIQISPSALTTAFGDNTTFTATGGTLPYAFSIFSGVGSISSATGVYSATTVGSAVVRVTDANGQTSNASITINSALSISPTTKTLALGNTQNFTVAGGVLPYVFSVATGVGTVGVTTGVYTASSQGGATVRVTDAVGTTANAAVTVNAGLALGITHTQLAPTDTATLSATGGVSPYSYSVISGTGTISGTTFTASGSPGNTTLQVTDAVGNITQGTVTITAPLTITPTSRSLTTSNLYTFVGSGGVPPYAFSIQAGGVGTIGASVGTYSSAAPGSATILVTDSLNNTATASVTVTGALAISPTTKSMTITGTTTFTATGGVTPYVYSVSGVGSINATTGVYTAPASAGSATVTVTDAIGNASTSAVTVNANLTISPTTYTLAVNDSYTFSALGGLSPYTFTVLSGGGSINGSTGLFQAPAGSGTTVVKVTDSALATSTATITINGALSMTPSSATIAVNNTQTFTASGGVSPYTYTTSIGTISSGGGLFTAPGSSGSGTITVTDAIGNTKTSTVTINAALAISPSTATIAASGVTKTFTATGGSGSYTYATTIGTINSSTGVLTPPASSGSGTVTVTDTLSNTSQSTVTVNAHLAVTPTTYTLAVNDTLSITSSGGVAPFNWSISAGSGTLNTTTGTAVTYTAPNTSGSATVLVTDTLGDTASTVVTINAALAISPASYTMETINGKTFTATGGVSPYTYSAVSGTINSSSGFYTPPASPGTDTVTVTDSRSHTSTSAVTIDAALAINPSTYTILNNDVLIFSSTGGSTPYTYSLTSGVGTLTSTTYTAPAFGTTGSAVVKSTDSIGNTSSSSITVTTPSVSDDFQYASGYPSTAYGTITDASNNVYVVGFGTSATTGQHWVVREYTGGVWSTIDDYQLNSGSQAAAQKVAVDGSGNIWVAGSASDGTSTHWIVREGVYSGSSWTFTTKDNYQYVSGKASGAYGITVNTTGDVLVGGYAINSSSQQQATMRRLPSGSSTWSTVSQLANSAGLSYNWVVHDPSGNIYASAYLSGNSVYLYKSSDGATWTNIYTATSGYVNAGQNFDTPSLCGALAVDAAGNIYFGHGLWDYEQYWGVETSSNGGTNWTIMDANIIYYTYAQTEYNENSPHAMVVQNGSLYTAGIQIISSSATTIPTAWTMRRSPIGSTVSNLNAGAINPNSFSVDFYNYTSGQQSIPYGITSASGHLYMVGTGNDSSGNPHWLTRTF